LETWQNLVDTDGKYGQPRPLVMPTSVNFCQNFFNLSRETVPVTYGKYKGQSILILGSGPTA
jgi:hypothetical protein